MTIQEFIIKNVDPLFEGELPFTITEKNFAKNKVISHYGKIEQKIYFLNSGIVQVAIKHQEEDKILDFFFENHFFCSYTSLLKQVPSDVELTALSDCKVEVIDYFEMKKLHETSLLTNKLGRILNEKLYLRKVKREKDFLTKSALEMYAELLQTNPEITNQIPLNKIAKYLGIFPESLSRIRKQIIS